MTLPTFKEVWSKYLFNQSTPITGDALLDENLIRPNSDGSKLSISAVDFIVSFHRCTVECQTGLSYV